MSQNYLLGFRYLTSLVVNGEFVVTRIWGCFQSLVYDNELLINLQGIPYCFGDSTQTEQRLFSRAFE